jgi:hypothetical protein
MKEVKRVCIYPKDIMRITGKSERYSRRLLTRIKNHFSKSDHQFITVSEFSSYTGIDEAVIKDFLND